VRGNLKVTIADTEADLVVGTVNQGTGGTSAWKVDPSGVTSPVSLASLPELPSGSNTIGGVYQAPTASSDFAITPGSSTQFQSGHVLKAGPGTLYSLYAMSGSVSGFLMTFNATTVPADGPVTPVECVPVPANSFVTISAGGSPPNYYSVGIVAVFSSTGPFLKTTKRGFGASSFGKGAYGQGTPITAFFKWDVK
jgi:hypothetical protein